MHVLVVDEHDDPLRTHGIPQIEKARQSPEGEGGQDWTQYAVNLPLAQPGYR